MNETIMCPICSSPDSRQENDTWHRCEADDCGHAFRFPQPTRDELAKLYETIYYPESGLPELPNTSTFVADQILRWFGSLEGKALLDIGCGEGTFWDALPLSAKRLYVGLEFDTSAARNTAQRTGRPIATSFAALEEEAPGRAFDAILMSQSIEHLPEPIETLEVLRGLAHERTKLLVATPNGASFIAMLKKSNWVQARNPTHLHIFSPASLERALDLAGWPASSRVRGRLDYKPGQRMRGIVRSISRLVGRDGNLTFLAHPISGRAH